MPHADAFETILRLESALGASWPQIRKSHADSVDLHNRLQESVAEDAAIVVFGSLGRREVTGDSDIDWTYLVDGQADLKHQRAAHEASRRLEKLAAEIGKKKPGREGLFGVMAFSHDILQYIGGESDSNNNLTRRILLLLESKPIGRRDAYDRVIKVVLERYLTGDHGWTRESTPLGVPRFLQNDISRYWRTVAVDFAYKQWTRDNEGWALKSAKLRMSRKLLYAAGLLYCFSLSPLLWKGMPTLSQERKHAAIERLAARTATVPLAQLAEAFSWSPTLNGVAKSTMDAYEGFLSLIADSNRREHLQKLLPDDADTDGVYQEVRRLGVTFETGLMDLFMRDNATPFRRLTEAYGVF